ncbi:reverse transcriptase [Tanacetum coccineum]
MVATRSLTDSTTQNNSSIEATLERLSNAMDQMNQRIEGLLVFQQLSQPVIDRMNNGEGTSNRRGQPAYGRRTKLEFPKFNGEDVQGWLYRVNMFITMDRIQEDAQKLMLVSMHLFDHALNWHKQFLKSNGNNVTWIQYEAAIKERFDPVNEDPMVELNNLKQVGSVQAYQDSFEVLLNKVDQPEAYAISTRTDFDFMVQLTNILESIDPSKQIAIIEHYLYILGHLESIDPSICISWKLSSSALEMLVPGHAVGNVMGRGRANVDNIRKISEASVEISDNKSSCGDRVAVISGKPEQKRTAESLIQTFIMAT